LGEKHPHYALSLNILASLYQAMGDQARARLLYEQARDVCKAALGEKHPDYATSLNSLATLYKDRGEYTRALPLFEQARDVCKAALGEKHPQYAMSLNNLAVLYQDMGDYARARPLLEQARDVRKAAVGEGHPDYAASLNNLALLYQVRGDLGQARQLCERAVDIQQGHLDATFTALAEQQRLDLLARSRFALDACLSLPSRDGWTAADYARVLAWKGAVSARQAEDRLFRDQADLVPLLNQLRAVRAGLGQLAARPPTPAQQAEWLKRFAALEENKEKLEVQLASASAAFRHLRRLSPDLLAAALPAGSALVDLLVYRHSRPDPARKGKLLFEDRLVAFVLSRGTKAVRVDHGPVGPIEQALLAWRKPLDSNPPGPVDEKAARLLREKLWLPLEKALGGAKTVLVVPDGLLCSLPFAALPGSTQGRYLIEERTIVQLPSARLVLDLDGGKSLPAEGLLALGGLDYGKGASWPALPGTALETMRLAQLFRDRFPDVRAPLLLAGDRGDRAGLLAALAQPGKEHWRWLHLSTHGFFAVPQKQLPRKAAEAFVGQHAELAYRRNPLLLCGLVLAGANKDPAGVLTAEEVCGLDLRGCEMVVLSACQTGLGLVAGGEGVLGLQRALHLAGAKTVVASLWSVSDPATSVLMEQFYQRLWGKQKLSKLEALRQAQLFVLNNPKAVLARAEELRRTAGASAALRGVGKKAALLPEGSTGSDARSHPAWWAAFVLSGDWR
jgi:CHAT domain-containing protein/Tfp pilus assembly protein PilF